MVTYIYFVKCPNCEDEPFDFFDEAKGYAMGCLSQKPVITQTEVCRNDFGECTDSADLGTVWSWEDIVGKETAAEPTTAIFTKDDFKDFEGDYNPDNDPEFYEVDNSVDFDPVTSEVSTLDDQPDNFRKPVPANMTINQLKEEMEENEDTIECAGCEELFPKDECVHKDGIGYLCGDCEDRIVKCTWCEELFDRSECRREVDLGWLCSRCEMGIKSRGETLTFREGSYWDDLDEKLDLDIDFSQVIDSSDMEIWGVESAGEDTYKAVLLKRFENVPFRGGGDEIEKVESEMFDLGGLFVFHFGKDGLPKLGRWDPELLNSLGNCEIIFDDERYDRAAEETLNGSASKREALESEELHDLGNTYDGGYPEKRTWVCYYNGQDLGTVEAATEEEAYLEMERTWFDLDFNNEDVQVIPEDEDDNAFDLDFPEV